MPSRQVTGSRLDASSTKNEVTALFRSPTRSSQGLVTVRNVREITASAIEIKDLHELVALSEAVNVVSRGGFRSISAMDSDASRMRGMRNRKADRGQARAREAVLRRTRDPHQKVTDAIWLQIGGLTRHTQQPPVRPGAPWRQPSHTPADEERRWT